MKFTLNLLVAAEAAGFDHVSVPDNVIFPKTVSGPYPYSADGEPILVAKTVGSAACLSGDRVALGVGLSWMPEEFRFPHQEMRTPGARVDEVIAARR